MLQATRKQREIYVGNLAVGVVSAPLLMQLFNGALGALQPPGSAPAVANVRMDAGGRFAFLEMRSEALAAAALSLDKMDLCGRSINVGRPKGYVDPGAAAVAAAALPAAMRAAAAIGAATATAASPGASSRCVLLSNLVPASAAVSAAEREELRDDVAGECARFGAVQDVAVPPPPPDAPPAEPARAYVRFADAAGAAACAAAMRGRLFDGNTVAADMVTEAEHEAALAGAWPQRA
jgi:splicing factor U2AF subunit